MDVLPDEQETLIRETAREFFAAESTPALIRACDVVVTISNTTAHLADALGKPTLLMLPTGVARHWYWHEGRSDSPWYPTIELIRPLPGATPNATRWDSVVAQVLERLKKS